MKSLSPELIQIIEVWVIINMAKALKMLII
jgi:hypothetical protein